MPFLSTRGAGSARGFGRNNLGLSKLGTQGFPATSGRQIYEDDPSSPSGNYWLQSPSGVVYQAFIKMDQGGGWINLNRGALGPYATPLSSGFGDRGGDQLAGGSSNPLLPLNASSVSNSQAQGYGCNGYPRRSWVEVNSTLKSDLGVTEHRWRASVLSHSGVVCGSINQSAVNITVITGTSNMISVCNNVPNSYSNVNPGSFTVEARANFQASPLENRVFEAHTACGGAFTVRLDEIYVR